MLLSVFSGRTTPEMSKHWRYFILGYIWALPNTLIGLALLATWYFPRSVAWRDGCLEVIPRRLLIGGPWVGAQTWGWVIFSRDTNQESRGDLMVHERVHVVQAFIGGPFFMLAYAVHFLYRRATMEYHRAYRGIIFEVQAYQVGDDYEAGNRPDAWGDR